jgi:hypothetical protein
VRISSCMSHAQLFLYSASRFLRCSQPFFFSFSKQICSLWTPSHEDAGVRGLGCPRGTCSIVEGATEKKKKHPHSLMWCSHSCLSVSFSLSLSVCVCAHHDVGF